MKIKKKAGSFSRSRKTSHFAVERKLTLQLPLLLQLKKSIALASLLFLLTLSACEEYFNPDLEGVPPVMVVEGTITNLPGPYTVNLSFSSGIYLEDQKAIENALVKIVEEDGAEETLTETEAGTYATSEGGIQGVADKNYKLTIQLQDGTQYESDFQKMPALIPIDTVAADVEFQYLNINEQDIPGYQFHVTTDLAEESESYLLWSLESTYKYRSDFTINYVYDNFSVQEYPNPTELQICWRTDQIPEIYTFNTSVLSQPKVERLPINFARIDQRELYIRYSLLVKQYTINKEAYTFWNKIQGQIESQEALYNNQPFQIRGNITNVDDEDESVLGYFMVAAQDEQRVFVDPPADIEVRYDSCFLDYMSYGFITFYPRDRWPIYVFEDDAGGRALSGPGCFDCRKNGGTIIEPEFWEE